MISLCFLLTLPAPSFVSAQSSTDCDEDTDTDTLGDNSTIASDTPTDNDNDNHNAHAIATDNANVIASENLNANANANGPDFSLGSKTDKVIWILDKFPLSTPPWEEVYTDARSFARSFCSSVLMLC